MAKKSRKSGSTTTTKSSTKATASKSADVAAADSAKVSGRAQRKLEEEKAAKRKRYLTIGAIAAAVLLTLGGLYLYNNRDDGPDFPPIVAGTAFTIADDIPSDTQTAGDASLPVVLEEWGDYQCPACENFFQTATPNIINDYVNTGKIQFKFNNYAFIGPESQRAAEAAACAADQGMYWEYHDTLYSNQGSENSGNFNDDRLNEIATVLGLDTDTFKECLSSDTYLTQVQDERDAGTALGVQQTPSLILNGQLMTYNGWDDLKTKLDAAIEAAGQ